MMNDEQFEQELQFLSTLASPPLIDQLRARDTAQREALARVEAERDLLLQHNNGRIAEERDTAMALLREADDYLSGHGDNAICNGSRLHREIKDHLAAQAGEGGE